MTRRASALTSLRCGGTRELEEPMQGALQMTSDPSAGAVSHLSMDWHSMPWKTVNENVCRLQARIVQAAKAGKWHKVQALQHLLTHSFSGKALAVRRVTESSTWQI